MNELEKNPTEETVAYMIEGSAVRCFLEGGEPAWFASTDLATAIGLSRPRMVNILKELMPEDKGVRQTNTPGGKQTLTVVSRSGAYQTIAQLQDRDLGRRLRKRLADIGVAYESGRLHSADFAAIDQRISSLEATMQHLAATVASLANLVANQLTPARASRPLLYSTRFGTSDLHLFDSGTFTAMRNKGFTLANSFLLRQIGVKPTGGQSSGLTQRTLAYCKAQGMPVYRYARNSRNHLTFLPLDALKFVHASKWRTGSIIENQGELFDAAHDEAKRGDFTPPEAA